MITIKFTFLGGVQEVGRSAIKLESGGNTMVFDLGVAVGDPPTYPILPEMADSLILSHAHLDHSGFAPALYKQQSLPVYATFMTLQISHVLQQDNVKISKAEGYPMKYNNQDVLNLSSGEIPVEYENPRNIHKNISMQLYDAGHIPGSAGVHLELEDKSVFYTGDINDQDTQLLKGCKVPEADILLSESTYGSSLHPSRKKSEDDLIAAIETTVDGGGVALVPVFAVGRTQEILMVLKDLNIPVYLDGMGKLISKIMLSHEGFVRDASALQQAVNHSIWINHQSQRKQIVEEPCVILTTAGMMNGGPVISYLRYLADNPRNSVLLTGYQVEGTNGRMLVEKGQVMDPDTQQALKVACHVEQFDFSAHADQNGLVNIAERVKPKEIILVHGEAESFNALKQKLQDKGFDKIHTPGLEDTIEL